LTWDHTAHDVCDRTRAYYHAPETALELKGMPLAPSGIQVIVSSSPEDACVNEPTDTDHVITATKSIKVTVHVSLLFALMHLKLKLHMQYVYQVSLCSRCHGNLSRGKANVAGRPPPLAICNNWAVLPLPDEILILNPTWAEFSCCALAQVAMRYEVTGRNKNSLRSHALAFLSQHPAAMAIPRNLCISEYYVVFANLTDSEIDCESKTRLLVRKSTTDKLRVLYAKGIDIYAKIPENVNFFAPDEREKILPHFTNDGLDSTLIREAEIPAQRPGQVPRVMEIEVRTSSAFLGASPAAPGVGLPTFRVTRSSDCMNCRTREYELAAFPDLHSNGLGTGSLRFETHCKSWRQRRKAASVKFSAAHICATSYLGPCEY
jgi:hypothetical protein